MQIRLQPLTIMDGLSEIHIMQFPFVIGRQSESDCALNLAFVSRRHCQFTRAGQDVFVQDLESFNGTYVNGRRASAPLPLRHGDELHLGPVSFRVFIQLGSETAELYLGPTRDEAGAQKPPDQKGA